MLKSGLCVVAGFARLYEKARAVSGRVKTHSVEGAERVCLCCRETENKAVTVDTYKELMLLSGQ